MSNGVHTIIYPVQDLDAAKAVFTALLGAEPAQDESYYVGYRVANQDIGLDPNGHKRGLTMPVGYHEVDDIAATIKQLADAGAVVVNDPRDVGGGKLIALVKVEDNLIGLTQNP